jgi:hypothetical protein
MLAGASSGGRKSEKSTTKSTLFRQSQLANEKPRGIDGGSKKPRLEVCSPGVKGDR